MEGIREGGRLAPGSLPHTDPSEAVRFQIGAFPELPAWPQLPARGGADRIALQELSGMPLLTWPQPDLPLLHTDHPGFPEVAELLRSENRDGPLDRGAFKHDDAPGFYAFMREAAQYLGPDGMGVKGQCAGPVTLGLTIRDDNGNTVLGSDEAMEAVREYLILHARWQADKLSGLGRPVVFFLDEPVLGSSFDPGIHGLSWDRIISWIDRVLAPLQEDGVVTGLHCCGPGPWPWVFSTSVEMFHFDARYAVSLEEDAEGCGRFLHQGGTLVWGVVGTDSEPGPFSQPQALLYDWSRTVERLDARGVPGDILKGRSLFSTACGLGGTSMSKAADSVQRLADFTRLWREEGTPA